jgi:hypothetical protein
VYVMGGQLSPRCLKRAIEYRCQRVAQKIAGRHPRESNAEVARRSNLLRNEKERVRRADTWEGGVSEPVATSRARDALGEGFERPALVQVVPLHHHSVAHPRGGGFDCLRSRALCCVRCTRLRHLAQRQAHPALKAGCTVAFSS